MDKYGQYSILLFKSQSHCSVQSAASHCDMDITISTGPVQLLQEYSVTLPDTVEQKISNAKEMNFHLNPSLNFFLQVYIATFVVSSYAFSYYRTGGKPFNPILGETYECDRPDKGFQFVAEQVGVNPESVMHP